MAKISSRIYWVDHPQYLTTNPAVSSDEITQYVTVKHAGLLEIYFPDQCEYYRILLRDKSCSWNVARLEQDRLSANFQGNPLWPKIILEDYPNLSDWFSLSDSSHDYVCILPLAKTVNYAIKKIGRHFMFQDVANYPKIGTQSITDRLYVDTFIDEGKLPIGPLFDRDSIHDWSYHFFTLLFEDFLENIRLNLDLIRRHIHQFRGTVTRHWNYYGHSFDSQGQMRGSIQSKEMDYATAIYRQMAISLDVGTAKIVQLLAMAKKGFIERCLREVTSVEIFFPYVNLDSIRSILNHEPDIETKIPIPKQLGYCIQETLTSYCKSRLQELERIAQHRSNHEKINVRREIFAAVLSKSPEVY